MAADTERRELAARLHRILRVWEQGEALGCPVMLMPSSVDAIREAARLLEGEQGEERYHIYLNGQMIAGNAPVRGHPKPVGGSIVRRATPPEEGEP